MRVERYRRFVTPWMSHPDGLVTGDWAKGVTILVSTTGGHVVRAGVAELKASLSEYLRRVKAGEEVIVTDHGRPIARLAPIARTGGPTEAEMDELVAAGLMTPRKSPRDPNWLDKLQNLRPTVPGARLVEAVIEEREAGW